jgi:hypothetical protein
MRVCNIGLEFISKCVYRPMFDDTFLSLTSFWVDLISDFYFAFGVTFAYFILFSFRVYIPRVLHLYSPFFLMSDPYVIY